MASAARRFSEADLIAQIEQKIMDAMDVKAVSPLPLMDDYAGDPDRGSEEFMKHKIDAARQEAYGVYATEADYAYWMNNMILYDGGWTPYWDMRLRGFEAGGEDQAVYGPFASYIPRAAIKKAAARTAKGVVSFALAVKQRLRAQGEQEGDESRALSAAESDEVHQLLWDQLKWSAQDNDTE